MRGSCGSTEERRGARPGRRTSSRTRDEGEGRGTRHLIQRAGRSVREGACVGCSLHPVPVALSAQFLSLVPLTCPYSLPLRSSCPVSVPVVLCPPPPRSE